MPSAQLMARFLRNMLYSMCEPLGFILLAGWLDGWHSGHAFGFPLVLGVAGSELLGRAISLTRRGDEAPHPCWRLPNSTREFLIPVGRIVFWGTLGMAGVLVLNLLVGRHWEWRDMAAFAVAVAYLLHSQPVPVRTLSRIRTFV